MKRATISIIHISIWCLLTPLFCFCQEISSSGYRVIEELNVMVSMRDGVRMSTNIYRPDTAGTFPVLLLRTPYGNDANEHNDEHFYAERGYVVVVQDTRGRYESEGLFDPFQFEAVDGFDTQEWIGSQPWCNGSIGTFGGSYEGTTQWFPAELQSRYLKTMFCVKTFSNLYDEAYHGGALRMMRFGPWSFNMTKPQHLDPAYRDIGDSVVFRSMPLISMEKILGWKIPSLLDWMAHPLHDRYWSRTTVKDYTKIHASVFNIGGWFDSFQQGTLQNFIKMTEASIDSSVRSRQKLIMGPWVHGNESTKTGDLDFGDLATLNTRDLQLKWFDSQLKGMSTGMLQEPPVRIFVMGANVWRSENEWPLARAIYKKYYLNSNGKANSLEGDGILENTVNRKKSANHYDYDPQNPVPNIGNMQPVDQRKNEMREDVLVFTTPILKEDIEVTGPVEAIIYASTSARNTDFTAKLVDVYPDGKAIYLCGGIIRTALRERDTLSYIEPGKIYPFNIRLWATSNVFKSGHRVRVEISSSDFPLFDRNLNNGLIPALDNSSNIAHQTIYHGREYPSCIILPVIDKE